MAQSHSRGGGCRQNRRSSRRADPGPMSTAVMSRGSMPARDLVGGRADGASARKIPPVDGTGRPGRGRMQRLGRGPGAGRRDRGQLGRARALRPPPAPRSDSEPGVRSVPGRRGRGAGAGAGRRGRGPRGAGRPAHGVGRLLPGLRRRAVQPGVRRRGPGQPLRADLRRDARRGPQLREVRASARRRPLRRLRLRAADLDLRRPPGGARRGGGSDRRRGHHRRGGATVRRVRPRWPGSRRRTRWPRSCSSCSWAARPRRTSGSTRSR